MTRIRETISSKRDDRQERRDGGVQLPQHGANLTPDSSLPDLPSWQLEDYPSSMAGFAAWALVDSGVAPLVAAARGYKLINDVNITAELKGMGVNARKGEGRRLKDFFATRTREALLLPCFSAGCLKDADSSNTFPAPLTYQVRSEVPTVTKEGELSEYEFVEDTRAQLDLHPGTPLSWLDTAPTVMVTDGILKADAALSAYLRAMGAAWDELRVTDVAAPIKALRALMERISDEDRVLIVSADEFNDACRYSIDWMDRVAWLAPNSKSTPVTALAALSRHLDEKSKAKQVLFLNLGDNAEDGGEPSKVTVDGFLSKVGTWDQLRAQLSDKVPAVPASADHAKDGTWRVSENGLFVERFIAVNGRSFTSERRCEWVKEVDFGGRIVRVENERHPTNREMRTGVTESGKPLGKTSVEIEVSWAGQGGVVESGIVRGPADILSSRPEYWISDGAVVPFAILRHPSWPPRRQTGDKWLEAVKNNSADGTALTTRWTHMGWAPTEDGRPVYLVGTQVIGDVSEDGGSPSGGSRSVPMAEHYGVGALAEGDMHDEAYRERVRRDFRSVLDAYIHSQAWTEESTAALVLAAALRPVVPIRPRTTIYLWGPKGKGKSWTAQCMMYFWAREKSDWQDKLPGQAKDTPSAIEHALAHLPIWVIDDVAPSSVYSQAKEEDAKVSDAVRAVFNNAGKARMNPDMTPMRSNEPRAQLIVTAENELKTPSVRERLIPVYLGPGKLSPSRARTDRINELARNDGLQARFTSHVVRYIRHAVDDTHGGWERYLVELEGKRYEAQALARAALERLCGASGSLERSASLAADMLLTFEILRSMAQELGMGPEILRLLGIDGLGLAIIKSVASSQGDNQQSAPGISLIRALTSLLASGAAHVISGDNPCGPPIEPSEDGAAMANRCLGWIHSPDDGSLKPGGPRIGTVITTKDLEGTPRKVVLFDEENAFARAQTAYPALIPYGQRKGSSWACVWDEGLTPIYIPQSKHPNSKGRLSTVRRTVGSHRISGVPVAVTAFLDEEAS